VQKLDALPVDDRAMQIDSTTELDTLDERSDEERKIASWRFEQLLLLGLSEAEGRLLADGGCDLSLVRRLVGRGCPPTLAFRIAL
jgi:hypothetical protein